MAKKSETGSTEKYFRAHRFCEGHERSAKKTSAERGQGDARDRKGRDQQ